MRERKGVWTAFLGKGNKIVFKSLRACYSVNEIRCLYIFHLIVSGEEGEVALRRGVDLDL